MRLSRRWLLLGGAGLVLGACQSANNTPAPIVGRPAPDFAARSLDGERITLHQYRGQPLVLNFFATWCVPCLTELPAFQTIANRYAERGLAFLLVDLQEDPEEVALFLSELDVALPAVIDDTGEITKLYRVRGLPSTFFLDRAGIIQAVQMGALDERLLENGVGKIIE